MRCNFCVSVLVFLGCCGILTVTSGADGSKTTENTEEMYFLEIPPIYTASRWEQPSTEAPASVEVITADEIKQCGATSILEALRLVMGINLVTNNSRNAIVNVRGYSEQQGANQTILFMVDGCPNEWDVYNVAMWDRQTFSIDEIERIEVVKGAGSSLYGANAYAGVINIITKTPEQMKGTQVNMAFGTPRLSETSIMHGWTGNKVDYKVSVGFSSQDEYKDTSVNNAGQVSRANALVKYKLTDNSALSFSAGRSYALDDKNSFGSTLGLGVNPTGDTNDYSQAVYTLGNLSIRSSFKASYMSALFPAFPGSVWNFRSTSNDTELQDLVTIHEKHSLMWGITSRTIEMKQSEVTSSDIYQATWGIFAEDRYKATDKLSIILGARYDKNQLTEGRVSPRAAILYKLKEGHIIMASAAQAFRSPDLLESYMNFTTPLPFAFPVTMYINGNQNLNPESVTSYEAEYRASLSKKVNGKLGVFYSYYSDFIIAPTAYQFYPANALYPGQPADTIPQQVNTAFGNGGQARNAGAEISVNAMLSDWLSGMLNYTYAQTEDHKDDPVTVLINETDLVRRDNPKNIVNAALNAKFKNGISAYLGVNWVDSTEYDYESPTYMALIDFKAYTIVNARIGYMFMKNTAEVSLSAFNLFDQGVYEGLPGAGLLPAGQLSLAEELGRRVTAKVSYKF